MKIHNVLQSSPEWYALRLGIPTSSAMDRIVTPKGNPSGQSTRDKYMLELLGERISGLPANDYMSKPMERGKTLESTAVAFYELQRGLDTTPIGFVSNDECTIGGSPDRFVGEDGQMEIKVPTVANHLGFLLGYGSAYEEYKVQVQSQLWLSGRAWNDVVSYNDILPMAIVRIDRDEEFIKILAKHVTEFSDKLESKARELAEKGWLAKDKVKEPVFSKETDLAFEAWSAGRSN